MPSAPRHPPAPPTVAHLKMPSPSASESKAEKRPCSSAHTWREGGGEGEALPV